MTDDKRADGAPCFSVALQRIKIEMPIKCNNNHVGDRLFAIIIKTDIMSNIQDY